MGNKVENIKPYNESEGKTRQVRQMFDSIAPAYDFMNHAMTMGIDKWWRKVAVNTLKAVKPGDVLDVATGTGDFAIKLYNDLNPHAVKGVDLSEGMLEVARRKVADKGLDKVITFEQGDCLDLKLGDQSFDAVTVAFGVRNFEHIEQGYREMHRVLRPGGMLCVLELSTPQNAFIRWFYDLYALHVIPFIGSLKSGDKSAYRYLPLSIAAVPQGEKMLDLMRAAGFDDCRCRTLTLGTCTIYTATKP
ncbi:MAG: bifunctional demethylmenaquinone methyltransferase/2-methoxy-6-polyprenyl-1,4-benzoquinol methylase UbiE [Bacteroidales bacterium]|nr:bifunctional demethylmenaquinone methyltransferase/2-methoxy-6-polyprenyl-1,4-benzoquinol methylase UbiE [Candidatus Sodaliphilus aphodohippi]